MPTTTGILLFEDAEELDFVGPWEVLTVAAQVTGEGHTVTIAEREGPVRCAKGLRVLPDHSFATAPVLDVVLVPGGMGTRREVANPVLIDWLRKAGAQATWVTSVCTGSLLLHEAGFARGKRVTTHWAFVPEFRKRPEVTVLDGPRYVRDGTLLTSAGVSAGIDMTLWLVGQLHSPEVARKVQRYLQYEPAPPYTAEV
jgi:transcriptional regulator GlxA family with amidase domain